MTRHLVTEKHFSWCSIWLLRFRIVSECYKNKWWRRLIGNQSFTLQYLNRCPSIKFGFYLELKKQDVQFVLWSRTEFHNGLFYLNLQERHLNKLHQNWWLLEIQIFALFFEKVVWKLMAIIIFDTGPNFCTFFLTKLNETLLEIFFLSLGSAKD